MRFGSSKGIALVTALVVLVAGCSTSSPDAGSAAAPAPYSTIKELVAAVAQRQRADQTARLSLRGEVTGGATLQFTGEGVLRVLDDAVSVKFTQVVTQKGAAPQETGFVVLPDATYLRLPPSPGENAPDRPWVRVDPTSSDPAAQRLAALATTLTESADPTRTLARYADATQISGAADDIIDGEPAVRYTIVVDLAKAAAQQTDPAMKTRLEQQVRGGLTTVTSTLWVDALGQPVRSAVRQDLPGIGTLVITGSYRDWGQPVEIDAPPATQVR
jgi:hypothetical protein